MITCFIPLTGCFSRLDLAIGWETPSINCTILEWKQTSLHKLHNPDWQLPGLQNCAIMPIKLHYKNCAIFPSRTAQPKNYAILGCSQLLNLEIMQSLWEASPTPSQKCANFPHQLSRLLHVPLGWQFPLGPSKNDFHAWIASPKATCKGIPWFKDLFLVAEGYMQGSFHKPLLN